MGKVGELIKIYLLIFCIGCGYSSRPPHFKKKEEIKIQKTLLNGFQFKQTSRNIKQFDDGASHRVIYTFDKKGVQIYFYLSCLSKKGQEIISQRQTSIFVKDPFLLIDQLYFEIPNSALLILSVSDPPGRLICVEVLKTGKYQFIDRLNGYLEVQVDGLFYMYVKKER